MEIRSALLDELKSAGVYPSGPCSAWPKERNDALQKQVGNARPVITSTPRKEWEKKNGKIEPNKVRYEVVEHSKKMPSMGTMAKNLAGSAVQALKNGRVSREIRDERYAVCETCPSFKADSKRCSECGCFMEAKTWLAGPKEYICPLNKWSR